MVKGIKFKSDKSLKNKTAEIKSEYAVKIQAAQTPEKKQALEKTMAKQLDRLNKNNESLKTAMISKLTANKNQQLAMAKQWYAKRSGGGIEETKGLKEVRGKFIETRQQIEGINALGTFNAMAAFGMGAGSAMDRTAKATEQTAENTEKLLRKAGTNQIAFEA